MDAARAVLHAGADKISINTPALLNPDLINDLSAEFGAQCVVIGIDSRSDTLDAAGNAASWRVYKFTGDPNLSRSDGLDTLAWVKEVQARGAGEIVLNCMGNDGVKRGYDLPQLMAVRAICTVPLVASGGAGTIAHFSDVFLQADVDGALAASVFHSGAIAIPALKHSLQASGVKIRC